VPTRFKTWKGRKVVTDFRITRQEWQRLHAEGINTPVDSESEVAV
jgi:hypothetical protein